MLCTACNKESKNLRVCPYCFTPYPTDPAPSSKRGSARSGASQGAAGGAGSAVSDALGSIRTFVMRQSPVVRWSGLGIIIVLILWNVTSSDDEAFTPGEPVPAVAGPPMPQAEAEAVIRQTRETALVDVQQDEVFVSYRAATFPVRDEGQLALVQQFVAADAVVEGRRRRIFFYNPNGKLFAQSDAARGVIMVD